MKITKIFNDFFKYLSSDRFIIKKLENKINFYSKKDFYLIVNEKTKNHLKKDKNFKIIFSKKLILKRNEKFLSIIIKNEEEITSIYKLINLIKFDELFKLKDIKNDKVFLIIVKEEFSDDELHKELVRGFQKYFIYIEETNYIRPYSTLLLEVIDENIFKYKTFLVYFDEKLEDFIYKNIKDAGINKKIDLSKGFLVFKRKTSKIIVFNRKRFYKIVKEALKEET